MAVGPVQFSAWGVLGWSHYPALKAEGREETHGYGHEGKPYITLPFADDFCLLTSDKRKHQKLMTKILDITSSMNLTLKPVKCKTMSICSGSPDNCTFKIGDIVLKSLQDTPEKFLGSTITFSYTIWNARHNAVWEDCPYIKCWSPLQASISFFPFGNFIVLYLFVQFCCIHSACVWVSPNHVLGFMYGTFFVCFWIKTTIEG